MLFRFLNFLLVIALALVLVPSLCDSSLISLVLFLFLILRSVVLLNFVHLLVFVNRLSCSCSCFCIYSSSCTCPVGGLYVGASAGAIVAGRSIRTAEWKGWDDPSIAGDDYEW